VTEGNFKGAGGMKKKSPSETERRDHLANGDAQGEVNTSPRLAPSSGEKEL